MKMNTNANRFDIKKKQKQNIIPPNHSNTIHPKQPNSHGSINQNSVLSHHPPPSPSAHPPDDLLKTTHSISRETRISRLKELLGGLCSPVPSRRGRSLSAQVARLLTAWLLGLLSTPASVRKGRAGCARV